VSRSIEIRGRVEARGDERGESLIVEVRDNGLGVPAEARDKLFQRFFRAHDQSVTGVEGTGLGLSIVRETVESIGGRAWAESGESGGSTFAFAIPCRRSSEKTERSEVRPQSSEDVEARTEQASSDI
jgi:signal transduction histidine kinase